MGKNNDNILNTAEIIFITTLGTMLGVLWFAYTGISDILEPILRIFALDGLVTGVWLIGGIFFAYIIRKPGSALLGELVPALVQGMISHWGLSSILYGFAQGAIVELYFFSLSYRKWHSYNLIAAVILSAIISYCLTIFWYQFFKLPLWFNVLELISTIISGIVLTLLAKILADHLAITPAFRQFNINKYKDHY